MRILIIRRNNERANRELRRLSENVSMVLVEVAEIRQMTLIERLRAMELLWDSLAQEADALPSPEWHGSILEERLQKVRRGEGKFLSLDEVKQRLGR